MDQAIPKFANSVTVDDRVETDKLERGSECLNAFKSCKFYSKCYMFQATQLLRGLSIVAGFRADTANSSILRARNCSSLLVVLRLVSPPESTSVKYFTGARDSHRFTICAQPSVTLSSPFTLIFAHSSNARVLKLLCIPSLTKRAVYAVTGSTSLAP